MKSLACIVALAVCATGVSASAEGNAAGLDIYILIGGRNMCGTARYTTKEGILGPRCFLLNREDKWEPAESALNRHSSLITWLNDQKMGPGARFVRVMLERNPSVNIGIVANAGEKTPITGWQKGKRHYDELVRRAKIAQKSGTIRGVLWHHGEADRNEKEYDKKLAAMVADLRKDLGVENLPFIAGEIDAKRRNGKEINAQLAKLPERVRSTAVISSEGCLSRGRGFDTKGMVLLGERYAEAMLKLLEPAPEAGKGAQAFTVSAPPGYRGSREYLHVYLLIGQSNMAGRAPYNVEDGRVIERCYLLNRKDEWEPAKNPLNRYASITDRLDTHAMNPGYTFVRAMLEANPDINIGIVSNARGATSIMQWKKGSRYYKEAMRRVKEAQRTGTLKGILWHQGESDERDKEYLPKLKAMVEAYRADLGDPNLLFVAGQINKVPLINEQIAKLPSELAGTAFASSEGLKAKDRWHFDYESVKALGRRYAEAMLKLQKASKE
jgi:hypothetical protein